MNVTHNTQSNQNYFFEPEAFKSISYSPSIFQDTSLTAFKSAAMKTHCSRGPSGLGANVWRQNLITFNENSVMIAKILSKTAITQADKKIPEKNFEINQRLSSHTTD